MLRSVILRIAYFFKLICIFNDSFNLFCEVVLFWAFLIFFRLFLVWLVKRALFFNYFSGFFLFLFTESEFLEKLNSSFSDFIFFAFEFEFTLFFDLPSLLLFWTFVFFFFFKKVEGSSRGWNFLTVVSTACSEELI